MDKLTGQEREQALKAFDEKQKRQYATGKTIVLIIATVNIISSIISAFINFNLLSLIIQISLSIALYCGVTWVRYLFAIGAALGALLVLYAISINGLNIPVFGVVIIVANFVYSVICSIVLFTSKSVSEFLYSQKNG